MKKYIPLAIMGVLTSCLVYAAVVTDVTKTGATNPFTTKPVACTVTATPADGDMTSTAYCWRVGKHLFVEFQITWAGAGTAGALTASLADITGAPVMDTAVMINAGGNTNQTEALLGYCKVYSQGAAAWFSYSAVYKSTTTMEFAAGSAHLQGNTLASGSSVMCQVRLPIVGWN